MILKESNIPELRSCVKAMKQDNLSVNLNSLLFGIVYDGESGGWTYFDELAHRMNNALQGVELTDDEIVTTINQFMKYVKENE